MENGWLYISNSINAMDIEILEEECCDLLFSLANIYILGDELLVARLDYIRLRYALW